jgi:purine-binding chemotaxis protein CheW
MQRALVTQPPARYLCVELRGERYAIDILKVREIQAYAPPTPVPRMPGHVRGVMNVHGAIVPVLDLRERLGIATETYGRLAVIVFVAVGAQIVGLIVDSASRVIDLERAKIQPPPDMGTIDVSFIAGISKYAGEVVIVLDVDVLLETDAALAGRAAGALQKDGYEDS